MNRYLISHPSINKESYIDTDKIKAALFSTISVPTIICETPSQIINYAFSENQNVSLVRVNPYCHFLISIINSLDERSVNYYATQFYRIHSSSWTSVIHGPAILFGSLDPLTQSKENLHYSIPYETMEQLSNLIHQ